MEHELSATSIKSSRIPLLPPLITNDIATEIQYYKQLAIAVEDRLKNLEIARENASEISNIKLNKDSSIKVPVENHDTTIDLLFNSDSNNVTQAMTSVTAVATDYPTKDISENLIDIDIPETNISKNESLIDKDISPLEPKLSQAKELDKSISDEDKSCLNETLLGDSARCSSDTITLSTDLNQYLNTSASTNTDTTETTPEKWKPQVPKTLDIVPISLDQSKPPDKSSSTDEETPILVRRGSYVLDTPSPLLLAHMQNEISNTEYSPSSSAQSVKRKEWNISQTKTDWESRKNFKEPTSSHLNHANSKFRKGFSNIPCQRTCKSVSNSKSGSPLDVYQPAKSVDCLQTILTKDCFASKTANTRINQKYSSPVNGTNGIRNNGSKKANKSSTTLLKLSNKLSGSLGSLGSASPKPVRRIEKKNINDSNLDKSVDRDSAKSNHEVTPSKRQKLVITSEKIVTVFQEIQETHKKQMKELMSRQEKEQLLMQENFKKQQIIILSQIRKAFPEISISALSDIISGKNTEHTTPSCSKTPSQKSESETKEDVGKVQINGINGQETHQESIIESSVVPTPVPTGPPSTSCQLSIRPTTPAVAPSYLTIDDIPVGNPVRKYSNVSRQLFPLDGKTVQVPIIDNSIYTEKHIKAATKINAYAKGFLVRRLMKTEKVIALKNTYREALHCMLRLHVDAPLNLPEVNFHQRLQLQCDAASMNIVDLFSQSPTIRMEIIAHDREVKKARSDRPSSARYYSFATQRTLARKKLREMGISPNFQASMMTKSCPARTRCQTWSSNSILKERKTTTSFINQGIKRSTSAGAVRKPWR